jgi:hypothetical protein
MHRQEAKVCSTNSGFRPRFLRNRVLLEGGGAIIVFFLLFAVTEIKKKLSH